jgi:uncharacterized membrane protein YhaH (DUF805 family)
MIARLATLLFFLLAFSPLGSVARAEEVITSFHSVIDVSRQGPLTVTETIKVIAEGYQIKRGIFRDFPLTMQTDDGRIQHVGFSIKSVERDGVTEDYHTESITGGIRIYIGKPDVYLDSGEHTFQITYETSRQIRFFEDHEELYWNVTGNGWAFPIEEASATVHLPDGVKAERTAYFTGPLGAKDKNARVLDEDGELFFATTMPLNLHEGLTIAVWLPKGSIAPPSTLQNFLWSARDNLNFSLGLGGFLLVLAFYGLAWMRVGRDPYGGVVVPRWDAPDGLSPAMVNYVDRHGFADGGWTAVSAAALNLAVKGYLVIDDLKESIRLTRTGKVKDGQLPAGEEQLLAALPSDGDALTIDRANGKKVQSIGNEFRAAIDKVARGKYYNFNLGYVGLGVLISIAAYVSLIVFGDTNDDLIAFLVFPAFLAVFFGIFISVIVKVVIAGGGSRIIGIAILIILIGVLTIIGGSIGLVALDSVSAVNDWALLIGAMGIILVNGIAMAIMGAPTQEGARVKAGIEGMRRYMTLAEKDRMNMQGAPEMSPRHFETLLPYAVALGVEKPWSETFQTWLQTAAAGAAAEDYQPMWYHGDRFDSRRFGQQISTFSSSMASTMASSLPPPPKSSSSGFSSRGGSSGGGGGGGGGGGW